MTTSAVLKIEKGKATNAQMLTSNTIRTVMGPTGTTVTFPQDLGLPRFFESNPLRYELFSWFFCKIIFLQRPLVKFHYHNILIAATLLRGRNVRAPRARMLTSIVIQSRSFLFAAYNATRPLTRAGWATRRSKRAPRKHKASHMIF